MKAERMKFILWLYLLVCFVLLLSACTRPAASSPAQPTATATHPINAAPTPNLGRTAEWTKLQATMSSLSILATSIIPTYTPTPIPPRDFIETPKPTVPPILGKLKPPAGMVYKAGSDLWLVQKNGSPRRLFNDPEIPERRSFYELSPDARYLMITAVGGEQPSETRMINLVNGKTIRVYTEGKGDLPCDLGWWKEYPDYAYGIILNKDMSLGYSCSGSSALIHKDGSVIYLEHPDKFDSNPSPGTDGKRVAYAHAGQPWIYEIGVGRYPLKWKIDNLPKMKDYPYFSDPAWSPSMKKIAWVLSGMDENDEAIRGIAIIDISTGNGKYFYPYPVGWYEGCTPELKWLENEKYLYIWSWGYETSMVLSPENGEVTNASRSGLYWNPPGTFFARTSYKNHISDPDFRAKTIIGSLQGDEMLAGDGRPFVWNPDGSKLVIGPDPLTSNENKFYLFEVVTKRLYEIDLPSEATIIGWLE